MAHGRILETHVKSFHGHWGSRVHGKKKDWEHRKEQKNQVSGKFRMALQNLFLGRPFARNKVM